MIRLLSIRKTVFSIKHKLNLFLLLLLFVNNATSQTISETEAYRTLARKLLEEALKYDSQGQSDEALKSLERAIFLDDRLEPAHRKTGEIKINNGMDADALPHLNRAITIEPTAEGYLLRAKAYFSIEKDKEGLNDVASAKALSPGQPLQVQKPDLLKQVAENIYHLGMADREAGNANAAFEKFDEVLFLYPDFAEAHFQKGIIYFINADFSAALFNFEKADKLKSYPEATLYLIRTKIKIGQSENVLEPLLSIRSANPSPSLQSLFKVTNAEVADVIYLKALESLAAGEPNQASNELLTLINLTPDFFAAYYQRGFIALGKNDLKSAVDFFVQSIELKPNKASYLQLGTAKGQLGDLDGAFQAMAIAKDMTVSTSTDPQTARPTHLVKNEYANLQDENIDFLPFTKATDDIPVPPSGTVTEVTLTKPDVVNQSDEYFNLIDMADDLFGREDYAQALAYYQQASQIDPLKYYPKNRISQITELVGKTVTSTPTATELPATGEVAESVEEIQPLKNDIDELPGSEVMGNEGANESLNLYNEGLALYYDSNFDGALEKFRRAINLDPNFSDAYYNSGFIKLNQGYYEEALADFDIVLTITPNDKAYFYKGRALVGLYRFEEAAIQFTMAIELNPDFYYAFNNRGNTFFQLGSYEAAISDFDAVIEINPEYVFAYNNRGNAHFKLNNFEAAIQDYDVAINLRPEYGFAYLNRGITHEILGNMNEACQDWQKASELGIQVAEIYYHEQCIKE